MPESRQWGPITCSHFWKHVAEPDVLGVITWVMPGSYLCCPSHFPFPVAPVMHLADWLLLPDNFMWNNPVNLVFTSHFIALKKKVRNFFTSVQKAVLKGHIKDEEREPAWLKLNKKNESHFCASPLHTILDFASALHLMFKALVAFQVPLLSWYLSILFSALCPLDTFDTLV